MRILLIKPKHIGDSLLLTPTIVALKRARPEAKIWVVVRRGCEGILAGCPEIDRVLTVAPVDKRERRSGDFWRGLDTMLRLLSVKFDDVFELGDGHRGRLLALLARAKHRYSVRPASPLKPAEERRFDGISTLDWETCHRVEKDFYSVAEFFPLPTPIPPLRFDRALARDWTPALGLTDFCVMQIGTRQDSNSWRMEGWREVCRYLLDRMENVVISCGPLESERAMALSLQRELGPRIICTLGNATWAEMAGLLYRAKFYVGLNTATMHLAAACGCPAVVLFGMTSEIHWRPWQSPHRIVTEFDEPPTGDVREQLARAKSRAVGRISAARVIAACEDLLAGKENPVSPSR
jgi:heptosyltransferase-3